MTPETDKKMRPRSRAVSPEGISSTATDRSIIPVASAGEGYDSTQIKLNVGGIFFSTSKASLCRVRGSFLEAMFSGRHAIVPSQDGSYFIDRDGTHFRHILNFVRTGAVVTLPRDPAERDELAIEADYFGISAIVRAIRVPPVDVSEHLGDETLRIREEEYMLRRAFLNSADEGFDPHRGLVSLFCPDEDISLPLTYQPNEKNNDPYLCMGTLRPAAAIGTPVTVKSMAEFRSNFNRKNPNLLHRLTDVLLEEPVIIAGGSVLRALTSSDGIRTAKWWTGESDVDIFLSGCDPTEANRIAKRIFYSLAVDHENWVIVRGRSVINIHRFGGQGELGMQQKCQIVLRLYSSPAEVLLGFDCDCCCCAYDGKDVWVAPRFIGALETGVNILNPLHSWPKKASYELRLSKYALRGFAVGIPGLDEKRIDHKHIRCTAIHELKGLARMLKASFEVEAAVAVPRPRWEPQPQLLRIGSLKQEAKSCYCHENLFVNGMLGANYWDEEHDVGAVFVPEVFCDDGTVPAFNWVIGEQFSTFDGTQINSLTAEETRDDAWEEIVDAGSTVPDGVPCKLEDSWDRSKRSREYLNMKLDTLDLDNIYYDQAYVDHS